MTLNGVIALIFSFLPNSIALVANYVTVVEDRPIMSAKYCLPVPVFHFWPKLTFSAVSAIAELLVVVVICQARLSSLDPPQFDVADGDYRQSVHKHQP